MTNNEPKHTPTPWIAKPRGGNAWALMSANICLAIFHREDFPEWNKANAEHIVHCVNTHETLVAQRDALLATIKNALTSLAIINMPIQGDISAVATNEDLMNIMADSFRAAIAKVEDKS